MFSRSERRNKMELMMHVAALMRTRSWGFFFFFPISPTGQIKERHNTSCSEISLTNISSESKWRNTERLERCRGGYFTPIMAELLVKHHVLFTEAAGCPMSNCQKHCSGSEVVACCHIASHNIAS